MTANVSEEPATGFQTSNYSALTPDMTPLASSTASATETPDCAYHQHQMTPSTPSTTPYSPTKSPPEYQEQSATPKQRQQCDYGRSKPGHILVHKDDVAWKDWADVRIKISRLPRKVSTWDIYTAFSNYGEILRVELWPIKDQALLVFDPPPDTAFWRRKTITWQAATGKQEPVQSIIELIPQHKSYSIASPPSPNNRFDKRLSLTASLIDFGFMHTEKTMMVMETVTPIPGTGIQFVLNLTRKQIDIKFPLRYCTNENKKQLDVELYRFEIPISRLSDVYTSQHGSSKRVLILPLLTPPEFYRRTKDIKATHLKNSLNWNDWQTWFRQTDVVLDRARLDGLPLRFRNEDAKINIGRWTTYRLLFDDSVTSIIKYDQMIGALREHNVRIISSTTDQLHLVARQNSEIWNLFDSTVHNESTTHDDISSCPRTNLGMEQMAFKVRYQLEVCLSNGYINEHNITEAFLHTLAILHDSRAIDVLECVADRKKRYYNPMEIFSLQKSRSSVTTKVPDYCTLTRSAVVTPSMIYFSTPAIEISNRVVRHWADLSDRFLRVRFTDEVNNGRISTREDNTQEEVFNRITRTLRNGIVLGDRKYEFLACGNSQFREHGAYFFASTPEWPVEDVRAHLGDLHGSKDRFVPAKWFARLGQNFSTTRGISTRALVQPVLEDIKTHDKIYCFTDGVGKISPHFARLIADELGLPSQDAPSVFQFRLGGCKGVLATSPDIDGHRVQIRPSQYKFAAMHNGLEIVRSSSYVGAVLNRQIILVLSALGVTDTIFCHKMENQLRNLELAMTDERVALHELQRSVDFNQMTLTVAGLVLDGFMRAKEPFTMSLLKLWRSWSIKSLKEKAKIQIELGACLLGCVDETDTLRGHYNDRDPPQSSSRDDRVKTLPQVFCYVDRQRRGIYEPILGVCILARNPSLHPGDIRVVHAVDVSHLHHLKNVVVLPQSGDRDLGNMCSGGDLDGDDYLLIWDQDLIPPQWDHPAMDFTPIPPYKLDRVVNVNDMTDFFVTYMKNDRLPAIAHAHMAFADYLEDGVNEPQCLRLAQLHSQAVDYNKSGVPATIPRDLRPRNWPHFMEKWRKPKEQQYHSTKVLGQLYDIVERVKFSPEYELPFDKRILDAFEFETHLLDEVEKLKEDYDASIKRIMAQHDITSEFEVWSTFVMTHNDAKRDYSFAEELGMIVSAVKGQYRKLCLERAGGQEHLPRFVAAMYTVTARQIREAVEECRRTKTVRGEEVPIRAMDPASMPLMSYPWIFNTELGKIGRGRTHTRVYITPQDVVPKHKQKRAVLPVQDSIDTVETEEGVVPHGEVIAFFDQVADGSGPSITKSNILLPHSEPSAQRNADQLPPKPHPLEQRYHGTFNELTNTSDDEQDRYGDTESMQPSPYISSGTSVKTLPVIGATHGQPAGDDMTTSNQPLGLSGELSLDCIDQYSVEEVTIDLDDVTPSALDKLDDLVGGDFFEGEKEHKRSG